MYSLLEGTAELKKRKIMFEETQAFQGTEVEREDKATGKQPGMLLSFACSRISAAVGTTQSTWVQG